MKKRDIYVWALAETLLIIVLSLLIGAVITALCSCTRKVYVPTETVRTEYKDRVVENLRVDTVAMRDSVAVYVNGDTVRITKYRDRWRTRIIERHDTIVSVKRDSVAVPYPVEKPLTKWERAKLVVGGMALGTLGAVVVAAIVAVIVWIIKRRRRM